jgi:hypothetical protein
MARHPSGASPTFLMVARSITSLVGPAAAGALRGGGRVVRDDRNGPFAEIRTQSQCRPAGSAAAGFMEIFR